MKIKEALDRSVRSSNVGVIIECLEHEDGLTYKELYADYYKRCKEEEIKPILRYSLSTVIRYYERKGIVKRSFHALGAGGRLRGVRVWLVK